MGSLIPDQEALIVLDIGAGTTDLSAFRNLLYRGLMPELA